jgi:hypothetical protein
VLTLSLVLAYLLGGFSNFFLRRPFVSDAVFCVLVMATVAFVVINFYTKQFTPQPFATGVDWRLIPAGVLILFALWILAALALACSTRLDMVPTLAICSAFFLLGTMSDYLFGRRAEPIWQADLQAESANARWSDAQRKLLKEVLQKYDQNHNGALESAERSAITAQDKALLARAGMGGSLWASVLYTVTPNWQLFWLADALDAEKGSFHWNYVGKAFEYALAFVGAALAIAVVLFEERELS